LNNEPLDIILFSEVMYCNKRGISGENPRHIDFIKNKAKPLFESWGYEVHILHAEKDYLQCFNNIIEKPTKILANKGKRTGFPLTGLCNVKRDCKERPIKEFLKNLNDKNIQYVGICSDEPKRLESLHKLNNRVSLLEKYDYTEDMARQLCEEYGLLSPCYELSKRGGCWFCPNAKFEEHKELRRVNPSLWKEFISLEKENNLANYKWNLYRDMTLHEIDEQIKFAEAQITIFDFLDD
jgi:hypothetical protein